MGPGGGREKGIPAAYTSTGSPCRSEWSRVLWALCRQIGGRSSLHGMASTLREGRTMSEHIMRLLSEMEVEEQGGSAGLQVFGLRCHDRPSLDYATLDESLAGDLVDVTEVSEAGAVPELKVVNKGDKMLLLMAGEQLIGAKQNRVLNASIMVAAHNVHRDGTLGLQSAEVLELRNELPWQAPRDAGPAGL